MVATTAATCKVEGCTDARSQLLLNTEAKSDAGTREVPRVLGLHPIILTSCPA